MSDIHGCYDDMIKMLEQIAFTDEDTLILARRIVTDVLYTAPDIEARLRGEI